MRIRGAFQIGEHGAGLALSPDGRLLAVARGRGVDVLDLEARTLRIRLERPDTIVGAVAFSPDGARLAVGFVPASNLGGGEASVRLFDVESWREAQRLEGAWVYARSLAFSADGRRLLLAGSCLCLWSPESGKRERELTSRSQVKEAALSADGRVVVGLVVPPVDHTSEPDGTRMYFASPHSVLRWDADATAPRSVGDRGDAQHLALGLDGAKMLVSRRETPGVEVREVESGREIAHHAAPTTTAMLSPDGRTVAVADLDRRILLLSWPDLRVTGTFQGHTKPEVTGLAFSRDGRRLVSGTAMELLVWER